MSCGYALHAHVSTNKHIDGVKMPILCYLTADIVALNTATYEKTNISKHQKVHVVSVKDNKVTFYVGGNYYIVESGSFRCR